MKIPVYSPLIRPYTSSAVAELEAGWVSNHGPYIKKTEELLSKLASIPYCILMNNGTAATECLLLTIKFKYPNVKYICIPDRTFIAPWSAATRHFSKNSIFCLEVNNQTYNIEYNEKQFDQIPEGSCFLCVHNLGSIVNIPDIKRQRPDLVVIEDNCEGFMGSYEGQLTGAHEDTVASCISFFPNKTFTSGEGGAFFTHDKEIYDYIKTYHSHGMGSERYIHPIAGSNFRMTNIAAALLYEQLSDARNILSLKRQVVDNYYEMLKNISSIVSIIPTSNQTKSSNWMVALNFKKGSYNDFELYMKSYNIEVRPTFPSIVRHEFLNQVRFIKTEKKKNTDIAFSCFIPSGPGLKLKEQKVVVRAIEKYININDFEKVKI
jgi:dTDP-4-amino-4,6-dideoxygalactose transaminase